MRIRFYLVGMGLLLLPLLAPAQTATERVLLDTEARRFVAMTQRDTAFLKNALADDLVYIHSNALIETKTAHLAAIVTGQLVYENMTRESVSIRRYGSKMALHNGIVVVKGIIQGTPFQVRLQYTAVYRKKKNMWQLVNWQSTKIP